MARQKKYAEIHTVTFQYIGTDKEFNFFFKSVVYDYLRENNVKVLSVTENIDTTNENDDLLVGFKGIVNEFYARDTSRKIKSVFKAKGMVGKSPTAIFGPTRSGNSG